MDAEPPVEPPVNTKPLPPFKSIVLFFERLANLSGAGIRDLRVEAINGFISKWRTNVGPDIYPAFQLILPQLDSDNSRRLYHIKEKQFGKILVGALQLDNSSKDAKRLADFKASKGRNAGNFAEIAFDVLDKRDTNIEYSQMSVGDVLQTLEELSGAKFPQQVTVIQGLIAKMNAIELKWIVRIVLGSMHLHVSEHTFFHCWHPDARALFNVTNDLKVVCHHLYDSSIRLEAKDHDIKPLCCFKPQRSKFHKKAMDQFDQIIAKLPETFYIEEKMDGERMQIHWTQGGQTVRYFSRKGKEYTDMYGGSTASGSLTPFLAKYINPKVHTCILDGEMLAYDSKNQEICPLNKVKQAASGNMGVWNPMFMAFDIVHLNGKDLTRVSLKERKRALKAVLLKDQVRAARGRFEIIACLEAQGVEIVRKEFEKAIAQLSEGLILKNPLSKYTVDGFNDAWLKVKPEFMSGYEGENFDLAVVGAYYGQGKRGSFLASFLCAVRSQDEYLSVCKVGNGFCMAMYELIQHLTEGKWLDSPVQGVHLGSEAPHKHIDPRESLVLEVKATQVWPTLKFAAGMSLRFPRFVSLRQDKSCNEALELAQLLELAGETAPQRNTPKRAAEEQLTKKAKFQDTEIEFQVESLLFDGLVFYLSGDIRDPKYMLAKELGALIKANGGKVTRNINDDCIVLADSDLPRIAVYMKEHNVVHPRWVFDCIYNNRLIEYEPEHYFSADPAALDLANRLVDCAGFSLVRRHRFEDLERKVETIKPLKNNHEAVLKVLMESSDRCDTRGTLFWGMEVYIDDEVEATVKRDISRLLRFGSASVSPKTEGATHVVCDRASRRAGYAKHRGPSIVSSNWVFQCWQNETRLDELKGA